MNSNISKSVRLVGPASSVHTRLWAESFLKQGYAVEVVGVRRPALLGLIGTLLRGLVEHSVGRRANVTVVHTLGTHALASLMLPRGVRNVVVPWGSEVVAARSSSFRKYVAGVTLKRADLVLVTSQSMADLIAEQWPGAENITEVVSWGVSSSFLCETEQPQVLIADDVRARMGVTSDELLVVAPRGTGKVYRSEEVRKAFAVARTRRRDIRLVVLGADEKAMASGDGEILLPYLSKTDLAELFAAADLVVSIPPSDQRSTTVLEAAASGVGLVLSDIPAYRELVHLGVAATLLEEPVEAALSDAFAAARRIEPEAAQRNRDLMRLHEDQQRQMSRVVDLCVTEE